MNDKNMNRLNQFIYYVLAPIMVLEFLLSDLGIITFGKIMFIVSVAIFAGCVVVVAAYKKNHPEYDFKANDVYTKVICLVIIIECLSQTGLFSFL